MTKGKLKVAFVGSGGMARNHSQALSKMKGLEIVGYADAAPAAARARVEEFGGAAFKDPVLMLDAVEPDAVWMCLPPFGHGVGLELVRRGIPFFVEKPVGIDVKLIRKIAGAIRRAELLTSAGYMNRYRKGVAAARKALAKDPPVFATGGWIGRTPSEEATRKGIYKWWVRRARSGGQFHEQVTHTVDLARHLMGEVVEVQAYAAKGINPKTPSTFNIDDAVVVNLRFESGAVANLYGSTAGNAGGGGVSLKVFGARTSALFSGWDHDLSLLEVGRKPVDIKGEEGIFGIEDAAFVKAVRTRDPKYIMSTYADGARTAAVTLAANESLKTRKAVRPAKVSD